MSTLKHVQRLSVAEYLTCERQGEIRHEFIDGELFAMVGASRAHNVITGNLFAAIHHHLRGSPCRVFASDMKVRVGDNFYYPDLMVSCSDVGTEPDEYYETQPVLIIEVLSSSTAPRDRMEKRLAYQRLQSLQEYGLVAQDTVHIEIYRRQPNGWQVETCDNEDAVPLRSIALTLPMATIYEAVQ